MRPDRGDVIRIFISILVLGLIFPVFTYAGNPPVYLCKKKLHGERPWVCGKYRYKCLFPVTTDGCSVPKTTRKLLTVWDKRFRKACEAHDLCYVLGNSKKKCDSDFLAAMRQTCRVRVGPLRVERGDCDDMALTYYANVAIAKRHKAAWSDDQKWKNRKKGKKVYCIKF